MIYNSTIVCNKQEEIIDAIEMALPNLKGGDPTWSYKEYNLFGLCSPSPVFYALYLELRAFVYDFINEKYLYMQSWCNYHMPDQVLKWHNHNWDYHGYICVRPHKSETVFEDFTNKNHLGDVYIGEGNKSHLVKVLEPYQTPRITIGFDLLVPKPKLDPVNAKGLIPFPR